MAHRGTFPPAARLCLWQTGISSRYLGLSCSYSRAFALLGFETCLLRSRIERGAQCCVTWWRAQGGSGLSMGQRGTSIRLESSFERRVGGKKIGNKTKGGDKMLLQCAEETHKNERCTKRRAKREKNHWVWRGEFPQRIMVFLLCGRY